MAYKTIRESTLDRIADAIRLKLDVDTLYKPREMAPAISKIPPYVTTGTLKDYIEGNLAGCSDSRVETLSPGAFSGLPDIESFRFPQVTTMGSSGTLFGRLGGFPNRKLKIIHLPKLEELPDPTKFYGYEALIQVDLNSITAVPDNAFDECYDLKIVNVDSAIRIGKHAFRYCPSLKELSLPSATSIGVNAFYGTRIEALYLGADYVIDLSLVGLEDAAAAGGYIYVPYNRLAEYQAANPDLRFKAIEEAT